MCRELELDHLSGITITKLYHTVVQCELLSSFLSVLMSNSFYMLGQ